jgi:glycosyltransferase EpsD
MEKTKRVLFVSTLVSTFNGFLIPHAEYLKENGFEVFFAGNLQNTNIPYKSFNLPFNRNPFSLRNLYSYLKLRSIAKSIKVNYLYCHTPIAAFISRLAFIKSKAIVVYFVHGFHFRFKPKNIFEFLYYLLEKLMAKHTDLFILINKEDYLVVNKIFSRKAVLFPGVGFNFNKFRTNNIQIVNSNGRTINLITIGELNKNKNQIEIIKAIKTLHNFNIKLLIVGNGPNYNKLMKYVRVNRLQGKVEFLGHRKDIPELLKISDIYIQTSKREGLPIAPLEAMASGLPVILSENKGTKEYCFNGINSLLLSQNNYKHVAESIKELISDKELRIKISKNAIKTASQYDISNIYGYLKEVFHVN